MAFLNEESVTENVKTVPVLYDKSNDEISVGRMVRCVYNKAANGTCSRDVISTTAISEMAFAADIRNFKFKFESLNFKFCLTTYVKSYEQIMYM